MKAITKGLLISGGIVVVVGGVLLLRKFRKKQKTKKQMIEVCLEAELLLGMTLDEVTRKVAKGDVIAYNDWLDSLNETQKQRLGDCLGKDVLKKGDPTQFIKYY